VSGHWSCVSWRPSTCRCRPVARTDQCHRDLPDHIGVQPIDVFRAMLPRPAQRPARTLDRASTWAKPCIRWLRWHRLYRNIRLTLSVQPLCPSHRYSCWPTLLTRSDPRSSAGVPLCSLPPLGPFCSPLRGRVDSSRSGVGIFAARPRAVVSVTNAATHSPDDACVGPSRIAMDPSSAYRRTRGTATMPT